MATKVIGVDLGGTNLRAAAVEADGGLSCRNAVRTPAAEGPETVVDAMVRLVRETARQSGVDDHSPIGVAVPGPLDPKTGVVGFTPNLAGWRDFPLGQRLEDELGRRVRLGNDGNCAAVGESRYGGAKGVRHLVYLALGTGVGGGVISDGVLIEGARGLGGEVGHVVVALDGPRCTCGSIGCLETYASGWAIRRDAELVATTADGAGLLREAGGGSITPSVVGRAAAAGDAAAQEILRRAGRALGAAIGGFVNLFNPEMIVIGGGIGHLGEMLIKPARDSLALHAFSGNREMLRIEMSQLGDDTALLGAAALAMELRGDSA